MNTIEYLSEQGVIQGLSKPDDQGVMVATTTVGPLRIDDTDEELVLAPDYWLCDCGTTHKKCRRTECPVCYARAEDASDALVEDVIALLKPV